MRIYDENAVKEFRDPDGDTLVLRAFVRHRDVLAVEAVETDEAVAVMQKMAAAGVDLASLARDDASASSEPSAKVREARLRQLVVSMTVGGRRFEGESAVQAYLDMDAVSAGWVDACVAQVWEAGRLDEDSARAQAPVDAERHVHGAS
jgi:hypothetical protein